MATFLISKLVYSGDTFKYETPELGPGLNIIEGENGTGKTTFFDLIYYAFGGTVKQFKSNSKSKHTEVTDDTNNYALLEVLIDGEPYKFRRYLEATEIWVTDTSGHTDVFQIFRNENHPRIFSDWLLEKLEINVVELIQGSKRQKINIKDIIRLIYHDQQPNPKKVYKPAEADGNYVSDSEFVRKTIFQLLAGKTYSTYYSLLAEQKEKEQLKNKAKFALDEYVNISKKLSRNSDELNAEYIRKEIEENTEKLHRLTISRDNIKAVRPTSAEKNIGEMDNIKIQLLQIDNSISALSLEERSLVGQLQNYRKLEQNLVLEATQLKKIMHSHDKLNLFSPDTCPYCLKVVERTEGCCVCGNDVDEAQYERFFYSAEEYGKLLKSKQKSAKTIAEALGQLRLQLENVKDQIIDLKQQENTLKSKVTHLINELDVSYANSQLDKVDDAILETRSQIAKLEERLVVEEKILELTNDFSTKREAFEEMSRQVKIQEIEAENDIKGKIKEFNEIYAPFMTKTLKDCRSARIDSDDYMPIINEGAYREASSSVAIRFNYFLSFLELSLKKNDVAYPRFLLVDTPRTAGLDDKHLKTLLANVNDLLDKYKDKSFQIILSTGVGQYPEELKSSVFETLSDDDRLLKPVTL